MNQNDDAANWIFKAWKIRKDLVEKKFRTSFNIFWLLRVPGLILALILMFYLFLQDANFIKRKSSNCSSTYYNHDEEV